MTIQIQDSAGAKTNATGPQITQIKTDLGLELVSNTADASKPVSAAQATAIGLKQDTLVSATNIKTINGASILGAGDLVVAGGGGVIVQDEGGALATVATTINFVGAGVVASGAGATKTITINGSGIANTDALAEGATNQYFTVARVRAVVLTGIDLVTNAAVLATDTVMGAVGKLSARLEALVTTVAGKVSAASPTLTGILTFAGVVVTPPTAMGANVVDITVGDNSKSIAAPTTFTWSAAPSVAGQVWGLSLNVTVASVATFPSFVSGSSQGAARTTVYLPVGKWLIVFKYDGTSTYLYGEPGSVNNFAAAAAPGVTDDSSLGYAVGSLWIKPTATRLAYVLTDATLGAAVWSDLLVGGGGGGDMLLGTAQTVTAAKSFGAGLMRLLGSTSGYATFTPPAVAGTNAYALPAVASTLAALSVAQSFTARQCVTPVVVVDAVTLATDAAISNKFRTTLAGNRTLANPTNMADGQPLQWRMTQDATGTRTLGYGTKFKFPGGTAPVLSTAPNAVDLLCCEYDSTSDTLACNIVKDIK